MTIGRRFLPLAAVLPIATALTACSSSSSSPPASTSGDAGVVDAGPVQGTYQIVFPSLAVAVNTAEVQTFVFDSSDGGGQCLTLINTRKAGATLPPTVPGISTQPISPCQLDQGQGDIAIPFGSYAVLVAAVDKNGADIALGCQQQSITADTPKVAVTLEILSSTQTLSTNCTSLSQKCQNNCN